jgi:hypothetical protein
VINAKEQKDIQVFIEIHGIALSAITVKKAGKKIF